MALKLLALLCFTKGYQNFVKSSCSQYLHVQFLKFLARRESQSRYLNLLSQEGGNLLLSGSVRWIKLAHAHVVATGRLTVNYRCVTNMIS